MKSFYILLISVLLLIGCSTTANKKNELVSQASYATNDSLHNKRIDLALKYSDETIKLINPPKKRIPIKSISFARIDPETRLQIRESITILPEGNSRTVSINSKEYFELLKDRETARVFAQGEKGWKDYSEKVELQKKKDAEIQAKLIDELAKEKNKKIGFFDILKYGAMGIALIPIIIVVIILSWLVKIIIRIFKKDAVSKT